MITKSRGRFGVSKELEGSDPGRGEIRGSRSKVGEMTLDFGSWPGSAGVEVGSRLGRGRVEVESGSLEGLCSDFVNEHTPVRFLRGW